MAEMRYTIKDSVFTYLMKQPEYARKLYLALHPEDTNVTEADCKLVTLENILTTGMYNDVGLQVRDMLILLVEAQSLFSINISLRLLMYLAATYKEYVEEHKLNIYGTAAVRIPRPELYMVYSGERVDVPEVLHLSDLYEGEGGVDLEVKVLRGTGNGDIVDQYVRFCQIADAKREQYGRTSEAMEETLRECKAKGILVPFLKAREKEVAEIMVTLFNQQKVMEIHDYHIARAAREDGLKEGRAEGRAEGHLAGRAEGVLSSIQNLMETLGLSIEAAMSALKIPEDERDKYARALKQ